jgi:hypothetical protein
MEFLLLLAIGFLIRGAMEHSKGERAASRDQRVKEVAKTFPKGALPKSKQKSAARHAAAGWWAREVGHGFPVHRTGWHAAWLAHQTVADHHKARREEARTTALETRASVLKGMPERKQRQAEAQKELDAINAELAAQQAKGSPATGRKAVQKAADEVAARRKKKPLVTDVCPSCGAPDGYEHLTTCTRSTPPLPADGVRAPSTTPGWTPPPPEAAEKAERMLALRRSGYHGPIDLDGNPVPPSDPGPVVIDTPVRLHNAEDSDHLLPGEPPCGGCGGTGRNGDGTSNCPVCRGWGAAHVDPEFMDAAPAGTVCNACGRKGSAEDPVLIAPGGTRTHRSHAAELHEAYADALKRHYPDDSEPISPTASPTTQGAPVTADTNYTTVLTNAKAFAAHADEDATTAAQRRQTAEQHLEEMQAAEVDPATLSSQMDLVDKLRAAEEAAKATGEHATAVADGLQQRHGGLKAAHDDAPVRAAQRDFYEGS